MPVRYVLRFLAILGTWLSVTLCELPIGWCESDRLGQVEFQTRLSLIKSKVDAAEGEISDLKRQYTELTKERRGLESDLGVIKNEEQTIAKTLTKLGKERARSAEELDGAHREMARYEDRLKKRLRSLYSLALEPAESYLFDPQRGAELERVAVYMRAIKRRDDELFSAVRASVEKVVTKGRELDQAVQKEEESRAALLAKRAAIQNNLERTRILGEEISAKKKGAERALLRLRQEADHLESLLTSITAVDSEPRVPDTGEQKTHSEPVSTVESQEKKEDVVIPIPTAEQVVPAVSSPAAEENPTSSTVAVRELNGLFAKGISLVAPVKARIVQAFGKGKGGTFSELVSSKGVDCVALEGTPVKAVAPGRVAFAGSMPGFGTVVVLDHGVRNYTMYGRLGKSLVEKGTLVPAKSPIGETSLLNEKGRNFYFEVRRDGVPVNPEKVVRGFER